MIPQPPHGRLLTLTEAERHGLPIIGWVEATCREYEAVLNADRTNLAVWAANTDMDGVHGAPEAYTLWGSKDGRQPVAATLREDPRNLGQCSHAVFIPDEEEQ